MHLSRKAVFCIPMRPPQAKCAVQCKKPAVERAFFWECGRWLLRDHRFTAERLCGCHRCFFRRSARRAGVRYSIACADNHGIIAEAEFAAGAMGLCCRRRGLKMKDRKSTRLNSSHLVISYAVFCLKKKKKNYVIRYYYCKLRTC